MYSLKMLSNFYLKISSILKICCLCLLMVFLQGCFWESGPPDFFQHSRVTEVNVIWDQKISDREVRRLAWTGSDKTFIHSLISNLDANTWKGLSVLPAGHDTRIILVLESGDVWEIMPSLSKSHRSFSAFNRADRGWTGRLRWSQKFIDILNRQLAKATGHEVDLKAQYRIPVMEGQYIKNVTNVAQSAIGRFSGYPETRWNEQNQKFEYLE